MGAINRQQFTTSLAVALLLLYILIDVIGKAYDRSLTADEAAAAAVAPAATTVMQQPDAKGRSVTVELAQKQVALQQVTLSDDARELAESLRRVRNILGSLSRDAAATGKHCPGALQSSTEGETAITMTERFLDNAFPFQASMPGAQCIAGIGIPGADTGKSRERRMGQRTTWHTYDGVRSGAIVVRYLLAKHPSNNYLYTPEALAEAKEFRDVYALRMREGIPTQRQEGMRAGYWGFTAALGISRKGLIWYRLGAYYNCSYVLKGDDDMYWNVPQYLHDLQQLPTTRMMWGKGMHYGCRKKSQHCVYFVVGMVLTMSRDVAMAITHVKDFVPLADLVEADDREESLMAIKDELQAWTFDHEDVLVGRLLRESGINATVYDDFRFHDCGTGFLIKPVGKWSVVMHRQCGDWVALRKRFTEGSVIDWKLILEPWLWKQDHRVPVVDRGTFIGFDHRVRYQFLQRVHPPGEPRWD